MYVVSHMLLSRALCVMLYGKILSNSVVFIFVNCLKIFVYLSEFELAALLHSDTTFSIFRFFRVCYIHLILICDKSI